MRKILCFLLAVLLTLTAVSCFAQELDFGVMRASSLYLATENGNTIDISDSGVAVSGKEITVEFSSDKLVSDLSEITFVAYLPENNDAYPKKENIYYLNQITYKNGSFTFAFPDNAPKGIYVLLMGADEFSLAARTTFPYGISGSLVLGDVNNDSVVNTLDIIKLKNYLAGVQDVVDLWTEREEYVADYNEDGVVSLLDIAELKQTIANRDLNN